MASGGRVGFETVAWFNGGLFDDGAALPLERSDIEAVLAASDLDWSEIDPSILGTLFERGLDPSKRRAGTRGSPVARRADETAQRRRASVPDVPDPAARVHGYFDPACGSGELPLPGAAGAQEAALDIPALVPGREAPDHAPGRGLRVADVRDARGPRCRRRRTWSATGSRGRAGRSPRGRRRGPGWSRRTRSGAVRTGGRCRRRPTRGRSSRHGATSRG